MIPKIIHQTWKTKDIPNEWKDAVHSCKKINKEFKYLLWTHTTMDNFVKNNYDNFYKIYKSYKYDIQRCDAFRYLVLYKYGGIYLDLDIVCNKTLNTFLHYDIVLAHSPNVKTFFSNAFFMVKPNHPFFKYCINHLYKNINNYQYFGKHLHVMYSTGPAFLTNMFNNYEKLENSYILNKMQYSGDCNMCNQTKCKGGEYFIHIPGNSWYEIDTIIYNFSLCNKNKILGIVSIILGIIFIKSNLKNDIKKIFGILFFCLGIFLFF
jgi:mannosyltransferase OCH1-like enzyme